MKKCVLFILLVCLSVSLAAERKLISSQPVEYEEVHLYNDPHCSKGTITYEQLKEDLNNLVYLFETAYIDYDSMVAKGFDGKKLITDILSEYNNQSQIDTKKVYLALIQELVPYIHDSHCVLVFFRESESFCKKNKFFYTNTFVEKTKKGWVVYESDNSNIAKGMKFTGNEENLVYYPVKGKNIYRAGVFAVEKPETFSLNINNKEYPVETYDDGAIEIRPLKYHEIETKNTGYVCLSSFMLPDEKSPLRKTVFEKYSTLGLKWGKKKNIIIDLRSNGGGEIKYSSYLLSPLYFNAITDMDVPARTTIDSWVDNVLEKKIFIESPATVSLILQTARMINLTDMVEEYTSTFEFSKTYPAKKLYRNVPAAADDDMTKNKRIPFKGKIILLTDRNTASAAEQTVALAQTLFGPTKQVFVIGENTRGCITFGDVHFAVLPDSGICINLASAKENNIEDYPSWHGEGSGFYPDYWTNGEDLNDTIFMVTKDREMKKKLDGIDKALK
ncbi:MAG: S41 family peptidase [Treponema sp.]|nr:S41 family peptidase [Treponema sp.]